MKRMAMAIRQCPHFSIPVDAVVNYRTTSSSCVFEFYCLPYRKDRKINLCASAYLSTKQKKGEKKSSVVILFSWKCLELFVSIE